MAFEIYQTLADARAKQNLVFVADEAPPNREYTLAFIGRNSSPQEGIVVKTRVWAWEVQKAAEVLAGQYRGKFKNFRLALTLNPLEGTA